MKGYVANVEMLARENDNFRQVVYTNGHSQLVLMSLLPQEEIGEEIHEVDQFLHVEAGEGQAIVDDVSYDLTGGSVVIVPVGTKHNIINTGERPMKLYTLYTPPHHRSGAVHKTKDEAERDEDDVFDGETVE